MLQVQLIALLEVPSWLMLVSYSTLMAAAYVRNLLVYYCCRMSSRDRLYSGLVDSARPMIIFSSPILIHYDLLGLTNRRSRPSLRKHNKATTIGLKRPLDQVAKIMLLIPNPPVSWTIQSPHTPSPARTILSGDKSACTIRGLDHNRIPQNDFNDCKMRFTFRELVRRLARPST